MPKLCLGSAQFGSAYGITNGSGAVTSPEVARILSYAAENSITTVDTLKLMVTLKRCLVRVLQALMSLSLLAS